MSDSLLCRRAALTLLGSLFWAGNVGAQADLQLSLVNLIATPERFNGQRVFVVGFMHYALTGDSIYLSRDLYDSRDPTNAIWLEYRNPEEFSPLFRSGFDKKYVAVEGRFTSMHHGHMGRFPGAVEDVTVLRAWGRN